MMKDMIFNVFIWFKMQWIQWLLWRPFIWKTLDPQNVQLNVLLKILRANRNTVFGKRYGFSAISSYQDYQHAVPVQDYESLRADIDKQE